jgi:hypothetical protein
MNPLHDYWFWAFCACMVMLAYSERRMKVAVLCARTSTTCLLNVIACLRGATERAKSCRVELDELWGANRQLLLERETMLEELDRYRAVQSEPGVECSGVCSDVCTDTPSVLPPTHPFWTDRKNWPPTTYWCRPVKTEGE